MSKVDLSVFREFAEKYWLSDEVDSGFLYRLFIGDLYDFDLPSSWKSPSEHHAILDQYGYEALEGNYGGEGEGEYCYGVIRFQGKFYKAEWSYYSYDGCEYDCIADTVKEVAPKEKTIIVYE